MFVVGIVYVSVSVLYMQSELPRVTRRIRFRRVPIAIYLVSCCSTTKSPKLFALKLRETNVYRLIIIDIIFGLLLHVYIFVVYFFVVLELSAIRVSS